MKYKIVEIGTAFSKKGIQNLESHFNSMADSGYRFHSVIQVEKPAGCLGGKPTITYLAVYEKVD